MNKKTMKIAGWALGLSLAVAGIGMAAGTSHLVNGNAPTMVKAEASYSFAGDTLTFSSQGLSNGVAYNEDFTNGIFKVNFPGDGNNGKYYTTGSAIRSYGGNSFSVSTVDSNAKLASITLTFGNGDGSNAITVNVGTYDNGSWSGSANSVTFTIGGSSGNRRIASVTATLEAAEGSHKITTSTEGLYLTGDTSVADGEGVEITLSTAPKKRISSVSVTGAGTENDNWSYENKTVTILEVTSDVTIDAELEDAPIGSIAVTDAKTVFTLGESFSFSGTVTATYDDDALNHGSEVLSSEAYTVDSSAFNGNAVGSYTITVTAGSVNTSYSVTVKKLTGVIESGRYYIADSGKENGLTAASHSVTPTVTDLTTTNSLVAWDITIVDDNTYSITTVLDAKTYTLVNNSTATTSNNANIRSLASGFASGLKSKNWEITSVTGGYRLRQNTTGSTWRYLSCYNSQDWRGYTGTGNGDTVISLIPEGSLADTIVSGLTSYTCDSTGKTAPSTSAWATLAETTYIANELNILKTATYEKGEGNVITATGGTSQVVAEAVAKYDYIVGKYGTSKYADFLGRNPASVDGANYASLFGHSSDKTSETVVAITIIIGAGLASVAGFVFLRHKREGR